MKKSMNVIKKRIAVVSLALVMCMTGCKGKTSPETHISESTSSVVEDTNSTNSEETNSANLINGIDWDSIEPASQDDFEFYLNDYDKVVITKYTGSDENVKIPNTINERDVVGLSYYEESDGWSMGRFVKGVFAGRNVKNVYISEGIKLLGDYCLYECKSLSSVYIPDTVKYIGESAFSNCTNLKSITIPYGITEISADAFDDCEKLSEVIIPDSVRIIGDGAFSGCRNLIEINIPDSVTEISTGEYTGSFWDCEFLKRATYKGKTYDYRHINELYAAINE